MTDMPHQVRVAGVLTWVSPGDGRHQGDHLVLVTPHLLQVRQVHWPRLVTAWRYIPRQYRHRGTEN